MTHNHLTPQSAHNRPESALASSIDRACGTLRGEAFAGSSVPPPLETLMHPSRTARRLSRPLVIAIAMLAVGGVAFGGYSYIARSWSADVSVQGKEVRVTLDGQVVSPDKVEWLPDGNCLVTVNGAKILLDPRQPGGANASISVQQSTDDTPLVPVQGVPLTGGSN